MQTIEAKAQFQQVRREFWLYFAIIYVICLQVAFLRWLSRLVVPGEPGEAQHSVFGAAYASAWRITPQIFSVH